MKTWAEKPLKRRLKGQNNNVNGVRRATLTINQVTTTTSRSSTFSQTTADNNSPRYILGRESVANLNGLLKRYSLLKRKVWA